YDALIGRDLLVLEFIAHAMVALRHLPKRLVGLAEQRELIGHALQAVRRSREAALLLIKDADAEFGLRQHLLNFTQPLLSGGREFAVGELKQQVLALLLGAQRVHRVAIRLLHLLVMDIADLLLRLGGLFHLRIEQDEILVFGLGLRQAVSAALAIPGV